MVYHNREDKSDLIIKLFPNELRFSEANSEGINMANVGIQVFMYEFIDGRLSEEISDSTTQYYDIKKEEADKRYITNIPLNAERGKKYHLKAYISDLQRGIIHESHLHIDKTNLADGQNFMITPYKKKYPLFPPYTVNDYPMLVQSNQFHDSITVHYFSGSKDLDKYYLPDSLKTEPTLPDTIYKIGFGNSQLMSFPLQGVYFIKTDSNASAGLTVLNFDQSFPGINQAALMIDPLTYIATRSELEEIQALNNKKFAVDQFWLSKSENMARARELIRIYYNRVYFANYYFTSFKEGWKTDRGKVFIVKGPPHAISRTADEEQWTYFKSGDNQRGVFVFTRHDHPMSDKHFLLNKTKSYNTNWTREVRKWREGNVFELEN
jgi:GWxTD domain-containing protein